jgi:prepilin-type N-terminal cleavage/methylation domain-containing protein
MPLKNKNHEYGFTLIEVMIAITLFILVMMIGTGAVLQANTVHKKTQAVRSVADNLNFVMEDMARNLRLGRNYHCFISGDPYVQPVPQAPRDCASSSSAISFIPVAGANNDVVYRLDPATNFATIQKSKDGGASFTTLSPAEVVIDPARSGFTVIGSDPADQLEPRVIIRLAGTVNYKNLPTTFNLETTVSQRLLDR